MFVDSRAKPAARVANVRARLRAVHTTMAVMVVLATSGCGERDDPNRTDISIIGEAPRLGDPDRDVLPISRAIMMRETAMGLVSIDATGQVEPALAESWIVSDDGRSIIFRIHRLKWPGGSEVTGDEVAASLKRALAASSENPLKPLLNAVDAIVGMTGRVVEIRLKTPRPYLLQLLAQPELGIRREGTGLGPWRITGRDGNALILRPATDPADAGMENPAKDERVIFVKGGRAALAVARFMDKRADAVFGGTASDWPIAQVSGVQDTRIRFDPAEGLFGLEIFPKTRMLKERALREALSMAIDRDALVAAFKVQRWTAMQTLLPSQLDSGQPVSAPSWSGLNITERKATAQQRVAAWRAARGPISPLRIALPPGPGMRLLFARLSADWSTIGIPAVAVSFGDKDADLRLVDEVAPNSSANWYLTRTGCSHGLACSESGERALTESRVAPNLGQRSAAIARADAIFSENAGYIPLAKPMRWSLVSPALSQFRANAFAVHPFMELRPGVQEN